MPIHPTAIVDSRARIAESAEIGPYCIVGAEVEIGARTRLMANLYLEGPARIGEDNIFFPYSTVGVASQDLKYKGERAETRIGSRNKIREFVSIHRGTQGGGLITQIGDDNLLMAYAHVAHDVRIGNHTQLGNAVTFAGHVVVEDWAVIEAFSGVHQFCRIGKHAFVGGYSVVTKDAPPYARTVGSRPARIFGTNTIGLMRRGFSPEVVEKLKRSFRYLLQSKLNTTRALQQIQQDRSLACEEVQYLIDFIRASQRGVILRRGARRV